MLLSGISGCGVGGLLSQCAAQQNHYESAHLTSHDGGMSRAPAPPFWKIREFDGRVFESGPRSFLTLL